MTCGDGAPRSTWTGSGASRWWPPIWQSPSEPGCPPTSTTLAEWPTRFTWSEWPTAASTRWAVERKLAHLVRCKHGSRMTRVRGTNRVDADFRLLAAQPTWRAWRCSGFARRRVDGRLHERSAAISGRSSHHAPHTGRAFTSVNISNTGHSRPEGALMTPSSRPATGPSTPAT